MSGNAGSSTITESILSVFVAPESPWFDVVHFLLRKTGHVVAYGILGWLNFRASRRPVIAVVLAIVVASLDEYRQSFYASRTGVPTDVLIDACGATLAQLIGPLRIAPGPS